MEYCFNKQEIIICCLSCPLFRGPVWMISAVPLPLLLPVGPLFQMRTSSASSCALRLNEWTSNVSPCLLQQTLQ